MKKTETVYKKQYARIEAGVSYIIQHENITEVTRSGKHEAVCDVILHNTLMLSEIAIASKFLTIAMEKDCPIEIRYFKKRLVFHCHNLLYPSNNEIRQLVLVMLSKFKNDLVKPKAIRKINIKRAEISIINKTHFSYFKRIMHDIANNYGHGIRQYEVIDMINAEEILSDSEGFIEAFIKLNELLIELLQYLNNAGSRYSGDNIYTK